MLIPSTVLEKVALFLDLGVDVLYFWIFTLPAKFFSTMNSFLTVKNKGTAEPSSSSGVDKSVTRKYWASEISVQNKDKQTKRKVVWLA